MTPDNAIWWLRLKAKQKQKKGAPIFQGGTLPVTDITAEPIGKGKYLAEFDKQNPRQEYKETNEYIRRFQPEKVVQKQAWRDVERNRLRDNYAESYMIRDESLKREQEYEKNKHKLPWWEKRVEGVKTTLQQKEQFLNQQARNRLDWSNKPLEHKAGFIASETAWALLPELFFLKGTRQGFQAAKNMSNAVSDIPTSSIINKVDDVVKPIASPVRKSIKNTSNSFVEKAIEPKFLPKLMRDNPSIKYKKEYIGSLKNKEINELNKNRIVELNEHWMYKNAEDIQWNKELNAQIEPLNDEFINFKNRYFKFNKKEYVNNLDNKIKEIKNNFQGLDPTDPYVIKHKNIIKNDPDYINNLIKERDLVLKEIDDYGNNLYRDSRISQKDYDAMSSEERYAHHLKIDDNYENLLNKLLELYNKEKNIELNPHFKNKIKNMYKEAGKPIPFDHDIYRGEGLQDKTHVLYPYLDESNFDKIPSDLHDNIYKDMLRSHGWSNKRASVTYGIDFLGNKPVGVFGKTIRKKPFNILDISTWGRKQGAVQNKIPDEIIDNHYFTNKKPEDIMKTVGHEGTHDLQRQASMDNIIDSYDSKLEYYTTHGDNPLSKMFKENLVSSTDDAWLSSGNELWADFGAERLNIINKLHSDPKIAVEMFRANESSYIDKILETGILDEFFKPGVSKETKKKMLEILGAINIVGVTGTTLDASDK